MGSYVKIAVPQAVRHSFLTPRIYEQVNRDIAAGYGIAKSVISDNGTYASQNVSVKRSLIRWLEWE